MVTRARSTSFRPPTHPNQEPSGFRFKWRARRARDSQRARGVVQRHVCLCGIAFPTLHEPGAFGWDDHSKDDRGRCSPSGSTQWQRGSSTASGTPVAFPAARAGSTGSTGAACSPARRLCPPDPPVLRPGASDQTAARPRIHPSRSAGGRRPCPGMLPRAGRLPAPLCRNPPRTPRLPVARARRRPLTRRATWPPVKRHGKLTPWRHEN